MRLECYSYLSAEVISAAMNIAKKTKEAGLTANPKGKDEDCALKKGSKDVSPYS